MLDTGPLLIDSVYANNRSSQERRGPAPLHCSHVPQMNTDMRSVSPLFDEAVRQSVADALPICVLD